MNRFGKPEKETKKQRKLREEQRARCPVCNMRPCSPCCPIGFTEEELQELKRKLLGGN